ncbi:hypothetical protein OKW40_004074 [Paraburkholderia sp. RAU6.4a]|uniref:hypothetical protein n=1 Tax=Paraburkholderia sp. RAU6.4a TaxID=2991067 RepID=UPI003D23C9C1
MVIRSHRRRFWYRVTPHPTRQPRYPRHPTATALVTEIAPMSMTGWLFRISRGRPNRTGEARRAIRLVLRRRRSRRRPQLRMAIRAPLRLFLPRRTGIHDGPVR